LSAWPIALAAAATVAALVVLRSLFLISSVTGRSMAPGFVPGDRVLVRRRVRRRVRVGSVVLLPEPGTRGSARSRGVRAARGAAPLTPRSWVIKRVAAMPGDPVPGAVRDAVGGVGVVPPGMLVVLGDNIAQSADSRLWGFLRADDVLGVVVRSFPRPADRD
jgi:signal peptidase I